MVSSIEHRERWLNLLTDEPISALDAFLFDEVYLGGLSPVPLQDLLSDWAMDSELSPLIDASLADWVRLRWGDNEVRPARQLSDAWNRVCDVIGIVDEMKESAQALRAVFAQRERFLGPLTFGPSRDPLGRCLFAVSQHQPDRSYAAEWWSICDLRPNIPVHHSQYGILGIRGLPTTRHEGGGFRDDVAWALLRIGNALARIVRVEESFRQDEARAHFLTVARVTLLAYPFLARWRAFVGDHLTAVDPMAHAWLEDVGIYRASPPPFRAASTDVHDASTWVDRARDIAASLSKGAGSQAALSAAQSLVAEQSWHGEVTGNYSYVVKTLCNFSSRISSWNIQLARSWALSAQTWEPWSPYTWTTLIHASDPDEGAAFGWQALNKFPDNPYVWAALAEALRHGNDLASAELVYEQASSRFPANVVLRGGWAATLVDGGQLSQAGDVLDEALRLEPTNEVCRAMKEKLQGAPAGPTQHVALLRSDEGLPGPTRVGIARLLRRRAAGQSDVPAANARRRASALLRTGDASNPFGTLERILLLLDEEQIDEAAAYVETIGHKMAPTLVTFAQARTTRAGLRLAPNDRLLSQRSQAAWGSLQELNERLHLPAVLGRTRSLVLSRNGPQTASAATGMLKEVWELLTNQTSETGFAWDSAATVSDVEFNRWWRARLAQYCLGEDGAPALRNFSASDMREQMGRFDAELDQLEEDFVTRFSTV